MTKYLVGPIVCIHLALTVASLFLDSRLGAIFQSYLLHFVPLVLLDMLIKQVAIQMWRHPSIPATSLRHAIVLVSTTWPIYTLAWIMAQLRLPLKFSPTPKQATARLSPIWLLPQSMTFLLLGSGIILDLLLDSMFFMWILLFALLLLVPHLMLFYQVARDSVRIHSLVKIFNISSSN
jgi:hypothetical protein